MVEGAATIDGRHTGRRRLKLGIAITAAAIVAAGCGAGQQRAGHWDSRILPIAQFVQKDRELTFIHPVPVVFLSPAAFRARIAKGDVLSPADKAKLDDELAELRALGLAQGSPDLEGLQSQEDQSSTVGYYDTETKRLYVEGTELTPYVRVTVAHELTHALQDQRLELSKLDNRPDDQQTAISALVEGDATVVEDDYRSSFSPREEQSYESEENAAGASPPADYPEVLADADSFPYDFGPTFVDALVADGGNDEVNRAFASPPTAEAEIVDPALYIQGWSPTKVPAPVIPAGAHAVEPPASFGQLSMAETLGARLGYGAWADVQGWAGDSSVGYREGGRICVAVDTAFSSPSAAAKFDSAARGWAADLSSASVTSDGNTVDIVACDPGASSPGPTGAQPAGPGVYDALVARADLMDSLLTSDVNSATQAECIADNMIGQIGVAGAVAYDQGDSGAPSDSQINAAKSTGRNACPQT